MNWFNSKNKKIEKMLRESRTDFGFDSENVKARIMMATNSRHLSKDDVKRLTFNPATWPKYAFAGTIALVLAVSTSGLAFASSRAVPGDTLFPVQKLQNQIILSMPLPETKKEEIRTEIVAQRIKNLEAVQNNPKSSPAKVQAAIEESQKSFDEAVSHFPIDLVTQKSLDDLEKNSDDKTKQAKKKSNYKKTYTKLQDLSDQHQKSLQKLSTQTDDNELKAKIDAGVLNITATKERLLESKPTDDEEDSSGRDGSGSGSNKTQFRFNN